MKVYYEIYREDKWGYGTLVCVTEDKDIAYDICKNHHPYFVHERVIPEESDEG